MPLGWPAQLDCGASRRASGARPRAEPLAGVQGRQPLPSWLSGASGPREHSASGKAREGRKARGARSPATRAPCTPKLWPAQRLCERTFDTRAGRAWTPAGHPLGQVQRQSKPSISFKHYRTQLFPFTTQPTCGRSASSSGRIQRTRRTVWIFISVSPTSYG